MTVRRFPTFHESCANASKYFCDVLRVELKLARVTRKIWPKLTSGTIVIVAPVAVCWPFGARKVGPVYWFELS